MPLANRMAPSMQKLHGRCTSVGRRTTFVIFGLDLCLRWSQSGPTIGVMFNPYWRHCSCGLSEMTTGIWSSERAANIRCAQTSYTNHCDAQTTQTTVNAQTSYTNHCDALVAGRQMVWQCFHKLFALRWDGIRNQAQK